MTCIHIERAREKLTALIGKVMNSNNEEFYEKTGPWIKQSELEIKNGWFSTSISAPDHPLYLIRKTEVEKKIKEIDGILSNCSCFANEKVKRESDSGRREDLIRSHQEEKRLFNSQLEEMKRTYKEIADRQQTLIESERRENKLVRVENSQLQHALGLSKAQAEQLEIRLTEKSNELNQQNQALERLRQAFQELLVSNTAYQAEARVVKEQMDWTKGRVQFFEGRTLNLENKLDEKQQRLETVQESLTTLRIKYETETASKDNELKLREKAIRLLKSQAEQSREELLRERLDLKEEKMEEVADELGIDLGQINKLRNYYENLINARESLNQSDISTSEYNIARIKQEILNKGISIKKVQKLCSKCEKAAKLRIELGINSNSIPQIQPQTNTNYSFSRERNWKNINSNFTSELVQEWKNHGFTYEECADWININSPSEQNRAIKEPAYYAWLRDVKLVDSYWVLNQGNNQQLGQEFFQWYQQQNNSYQARQEIPTNNYR